MDFVSSFAQFLRTTAGKLSGPHDFDTSNDPRISTIASSVTVKLFKILFSFKMFLKTDETVKTEPKYLLKREAFSAPQFATSLFHLTWGGTGGPFRKLLKYLFMAWEFVSWNALIRNFSGLGLRLLLDCFSTFLSWVSTNHCWLVNFVFSEAC